MNLIELVTQIDSEEKARKFLEKMRWPKGIVCPRCGHPHISRLEAYHKFECAKCEYQFSVTAGTIFHGTRVALRKWLIVVSLMVESKKGISAKQIERTIGVSYPTAWYMMHRVRSAMKTDGNEASLFGILEMDETYVGGKERGIGPGRPGKRSKNTAILGIIERNGRVQCRAVQNVGMREIMDFATSAVRHGAVDVIYTDQMASYRIFDSVYPHKPVNHVVSFVDGDIHTNGIEGFWSLLKRGINGAFHHVSAEHLPRYLDEFMWRFNHRRGSDSLSILLHGCERHHIAYSELAS
ncbi:MAG: IS1595 family transposase [Candidatus Bipolaricaulota bacterium]|nr:IS1595 family transposase [Candidatus Bipolaricaulota bacterium]